MGALHLLLALAFVLAVYGACAVASLPDWLRPYVIYAAMLGGVLLLTSFGRAMP